MIAIVHKTGCAHLYGSPAPPCTCGVIDRAGWCHAAEQAPMNTTLLGFWAPDEYDLCRYTPRGWEPAGGGWVGMVVPDCWRKISAPLWPEVAELADVAPCPVGTCEAEHDACGERDCPHGEPLHYHYDGCPACDMPEVKP